MWNIHQQLCSKLALRGVHGHSDKHATRHVPGSAMCVQNFDDSRGFAIRITYRISLRSSSLWEPRHPLLKVVLVFQFWYVTWNTRHHHFALHIIPIHSRYHRRRAILQITLPSHIPGLPLFFGVSYYIASYLRQCHPELFLLENRNQATRGPISTSSTAFHLAD